MSYIPARIKSLKKRDKRSFVHSRRFGYMDSGQNIFLQNIQSELSNSGLVWGALAFILRITRFFGTAPLKFIHGRNGCWDIRISSVMCIYSYTFIVMLNIMLYTGFVIDIYLPDDRSVRVRSDLYFTVWFMDMLIVTIISTYGILIGPSKMKRLMASMNHIHMILSALKCKHIMHKPEKIRCWIIVSSMLGLIFLCLQEVIIFQDAARSQERSMTVYWLYTMSYVQMFILYLLELQFVLTAMVPCTALKFLNNELTALGVDIDMKTKSSHEGPASDFRRSSDNIPPCKVNNLIDTVAMRRNPYYKDNRFSDMDLRGWVQKIRRLSLAYSGICEVVRQIDRSNGLLLLLLLVSFLIHLVVTPYYIITIHISLTDLTVMQFVWWTYHISKTVMIVEPGHRLKQEIVKTQGLVVQLMNCLSLHDPIVDQLNIFHKQIVLNPVEFSPLGICTLSRPLIASILGAVTTYLVILVQFKSFKFAN